MADERRAALPAGMKRARGRIERWRRMREKRTAMPEDLWSEAVALAKTHGVYGTAKALTVGYDALKRRVEQTPAAKKRPNDAAAAGGFVELGGSDLLGSAGAVVELAREDGARLTLRMPAGQVLDVAGLAAVFWGRGA